MTLPVVTAVLSARSCLPLLTCADATPTLKVSGHTSSSGGAKCWSVRWDTYLLTVMTAVLCAPFCWTQPAGADEIYPLALM